MPLAGLVLNRVHTSTAMDLSAERAAGAAEDLAERRNMHSPRRCSGCTPSTMQTVARERHLLQRFSGAHPGVAVATPRRSPATSTT